MTTPHQKQVPERFTREQGFTPTDWERTLSGAVAGHRLDRPEPARAVVHLSSGGRLILRWRTLAPRQIALMRMPRLEVEYRFEEVDAAARSAFMRGFDLYTQRGGG